MPPSNQDQTNPNNKIGPQSITLKSQAWAAKDKLDEGLRLMIIKKYSDTLNVLIK